MAAVENLRLVINERLTEAVEEILGVFTRTISAYEEEIHRQRALLELVLRPEVKLHRTELPPQNVCEGEQEVLPDQQLCYQETSSGLDPENPGGLTRVIKEEPEEPEEWEEPEELRGVPEEERLVLKQETEFSFPHERNDRREGRTLRLEPDGDQKAAEEEGGEEEEGEEEEEERPPDSGPPDNARELERRRRSAAALRFVFPATRPTPGVKPSDKPFECDVCGRDFYLYTHLKVHMMTHPAGDKPFSCAACGKGFGFKRNLKRHMATHSGERPHACARCPRTFRRVEHLRVHTRSHTGERPYRCAYCGKALSTNSALTKHVRRHEEETTTTMTAATPGGAGFRGSLRTGRVRSEPLDPEDESDLLTPETLAEEKKV